MRGVQDGMPFDSGVSRVKHGRAGRRQSCGSSRLAAESRLTQHAADRQTASHTAASNAEPVGNLVQVPIVGRLRCRRRGGHEPQSAVRRPISLVASLLIALVRHAELTIGAINSTAS